MRRNRFHLQWVLLVALCFSGCGRQPLKLSLSAEVKRPERSVVVFFVDGMDEARLDELLASGRLPNIQKRFVDGGVHVESAIAALPAISYPNGVSLLTGCFPGHHGILGNQVFDRARLTWIDYITLEHYMQVNQDFSRPTIYEMLDDRLTVNVQCHTQRGVTHSFDNMLETGPAWYIGLHIPVNQYVASCVEQIGAMAERVRMWPVLTTFYFPGLDAAGHAQGSQSDYYAQVLEDVDHQIGRVTNAMEAAGLLNNSYLVLVTDHGHPRADKAESFDLIDWLKRERKIRCHLGPVPGGTYADRFEFLDKYDVMLVDGSHRRVMLYLRGEDGWGERATKDQIEAFIGASGDQPDSSIERLPAVEFVCRKLGENSVEVRSAAGSLAVERRIAGSLKEYRIVSNGNETFDLIGPPMSAETEAFDAFGWHDSQAWLRRTARSKHPDFVSQIIEVFDSPAAGDIVIFMAHDWVLAGHGGGEHGSCLAADMRIPMYFAGPDLSGGSAVECGRIVDVVPTILDLLGAVDRLDRFPAIDGVSLAPQLRAATIPSP